MVMEEEVMMVELVERIFGGAARGAKEKKRLLAEFETAGQLIPVEESHGLTNADCRGKQSEFMQGSSQSRQIAGNEDFEHCFTVHFEPLQVTDTAVNGLAKTLSRICPAEVLLLQKAKYPSTYNSFCTAMLTDCTLAIND